MSAERNTRQRRTIREVVERAGRPLSTDEILSRRADVDAVARTSDGIPLDPRALR